MSLPLSRTLWVGWAMALVGGLALLAGVILALRDPCVEAGEVATGCQGVPTAVVALALGGTIVATLGGGVATVAALRRGRGGSGR